MKNIHFYIKINASITRICCKNICPVHRVGRNLGLIRFGLELPVYNHIPDLHGLPGVNTIGLQFPELVAPACIHSWRDYLWLPVDDRQKQQPRVL